MSPAIFPNVSGRQITVVAITSLCGLGCIAYMVLVRRRNDTSRKRLHRWKGRKSLPLGSDIIWQSAEKAGLGKTNRNYEDIQQQDLDDLLVAMDQLQYLLSCIRERDLLTESAGYVISIKEKIVALSNMIDNRAGKVQIRSLNKALPSKENEDCPFNATAVSKAIVPKHVDDDGYDDDNDSLCSDDSFVSASESIPDANLIAMDITCDGETRALLLQYGQLDFYREGIKEYTNHGINVRTIRTEMLGCENDADFKIKVHCIRQAFVDLLQKDECRKWLLETGHNLLVDLMKIGEKNIIDFERDFGILLDYCQGQRNWIEIEKELKGRQVCCMNFYDIVLDFVIMDSFDDLANPPYVLTSVIQNGWLTDSIKETALSTAVWSLLAAKVRMLNNPNAFMAKLYQLSQHVTPILVWGLLGPNGKLKNSCNSFKDILLGFLQDIFSLGRCNYKTKDTLSEDIITNAKQRLLQKENL